MNDIEKNKQFTRRLAPFILMLALLIFVIRMFTGCSSITAPNDQAVTWSCVENTLWYITGTYNNLEEWRFYEDSVIIYEYRYSPVDQEYADYEYPQYTVMSIFRRKLEIYRKDIPYEDGDGQKLYLQEYRGYTTTLEGVKIKDNSQYSAIFIAGVFQDKMYLGLFDELEEVQVYWTFYYNPPHELDFRNYPGWELYR